MEVDSEDTVHIIYGIDLPPEGNTNLQYVNLSSTGWSNTIRMTDGSTSTWPIEFIIGSDGKIHIVYLESTGLTTYYTNATGESGFRILPATPLGRTQYIGATISADLANTIHLIYPVVDGNWNFGYKNLTDAGFTNQIILNSNGPDGRWMCPRSLWRYSPPGNIPANNARFVGVFIDTGTGNMSLRYGEFPISPSPWTFKSGLESWQGVVITTTDLIYLFILVVMVMVILYIALRMFIPGNYGGEL